MRSPHLPFRLLALALLAGFTLPVLVQDGMFMDAMLYTCVSRNLAQGFGSFWFPQFSLASTGGLRSFHEQPPLGFGIQALFFKLFGSGIYTERLYTLVTLCVTAWLIVVLWKKIFRDDVLIARMSWLPLMLWITIPVCFWSYSNNMHENTMGIFTLAAVIMLFDAMQTEKQKALKLLLGGALITMAALTKGIPGLFPITVPILHAIVLRRHPLRRALSDTLMVLIIPVIVYASLIAMPQSRESLRMYFIDRLLHRIHNDPTTDSRRFILYRLTTELIAPILFAALMFVIGKRKKITSQHLRLATFFIFVGLAGSLPLMLTRVQKGFYFVPSLPFFAVGFSIIAAPVVNAFVLWLSTGKSFYNAALAIALILVVTSFALTSMNIGKASRDRAMLHDVHRFENIVTSKDSVGLEPESWQNWSLQCYVMRYSGASMFSGYNGPYYVTSKNHVPDTLRYKLLSLNTQAFDLYQRR